MPPFPPVWPRPQHCLTAADLTIPPAGARVAVAGLVTCRQRPGTAKGVVFLTLEDETSTANIVIWAKTFLQFRCAVISGRCLKVTGQLQRDGDVTHVVAERIEDISALLDAIVTCDAPKAMMVPAEPPRTRHEPRSPELTAD